ncbi:peptidoglycan recognition protein, partial [Schaalia naturae]|uniref:peptidoglycan recognition protein family protein n=1 Tax=Schaalia naturae TaxID=635203 RepID=UPI00362F60E8
MSTTLTVSLVAVMFPASAEASLALASADDVSPVMTLPLTDSQGTPTDIAVSALDDPEAAPSVAPVPSENGGASTLTGPQEADDGQEIEDIAVLTEPLAVADDFLVAGVTWDASQSLSEENEIYLRVREGDTWSDWTPMGSDGSGRDDGVGLSGTEPFLTGGADAMQIEVTGDSAALPADLSVSMIPANPQGETTLDSSDVNPTEAEPTPLAPAEEHEEQNEQGNSPAQSGPTNDEGASDTTSQSGTPSSQDAPNAGTGGSVGSGGSAIINSQALLAATSSSNALPVDVITRSEWGANESYMTWTPEEANAPFVIVHHTVGTNSYSASQSASIVNGIYYYHAVTLGWGDIGYNFLVDKYGQVFEGRAGSAEASAGKMVAGAHAQGANTGTMGIAMMGTYTSESPTSAELTSVGKMAGWQLGRAGVDPNGSSTFTITYSNGKYKVGDKINLNRVSGHRDVYATACPGDAGYAALSTVRGVATAAIAQENGNPVGSIDSITADRSTGSIV